MICTAEDRTAASAPGGRVGYHGLQAHYAPGYYYGLLHFVVTPLVLAWLYLRRPVAFGRLRSALILATAAANVVFCAWPAAPAPKLWTGSSRHRRPSRQT